ncbi:hypothetical protein [Altericista sp. CCNU0014]|uniref:hypothetical protein n=1 Tax=Altericista sp. CCNU0014 TaxID=3082949 RepID=UPI00384E8EFB
MSSISSNAFKTPISLSLRIWLGIEILFGIAAIGAVFARPEATATNFAWTIKPTVMAATFGAFYLSVGLLFVLGAVARRWQQVRVVSIPAAVFTAFMLLTTFLHWDKFTIGTLPFYVWFVSYLLPPPIFALLYRLHQHRSAPIGLGRTRPLARPIRRFFLMNGLVLVSLALLIYLFPILLIAIAPWTFTPLTARTLCGWLIGVSLLEVWIAWEGDWQRVKIGTAMLVILPFALIFQLVRFRSEVQWNNMPLWMLLVDFSIASLLCLALWFGFETNIAKSDKILR